MLVLKHAVLICVGVRVHMHGSDIHVLLRAIRGPCGVTDLSYRATGSATPLLVK